MWITEYLFLNHRSLKWAPGQPDGSSSQNAVVLMVETKKFNDVINEKRACVACEGNKNATFTMRGNCVDSLFGNKEYQIK